uniref:KIB1-4 beta-propeller domain-containing protein n=1 Tax=Leersia perrieri TaxID=77586 RepID=A0A0D9V0D6_9ORYZ
MVRLRFRKNDLTTFCGHTVRDISPKHPEHNPGPEMWVTKYDAAETRHHFYQRAVLSGDPSSQGSKCIVVLIHNPWNQLSFARIGDPTWTWLTAQPDCSGYHDCFFDENDGLLYAIKDIGEIHAIDFNGPAPVITRIADELEFSFHCVNYIFRAPWGDIILVWRQLDFKGDEDPTTTEVTVLEFDLATQDLVQIKDLRGHALFVSLGTSFFVSVSDFPVLTPNCVYLAHDNTKCRNYKHTAEEVRVYNIQDDTSVDQPTLSSWENFPSPALWVQPTLSLNK